MSRLERWLVWGSTAAVSLTGFGYAWMKYLLLPADEFAVINHPLQPLVLKLHILTAPVLVFAVGLIAARHIIPHLIAGVKRARRSGVSAALVVLPMILSGYLIQAVTSMPLVSALAWSHLLLGSLFALAAGAHAVATRVRVRRAAARQAMPGEETARSHSFPPAEGGGAHEFSPWPAKSPRVSGRKLRSTASQRVLENG